MKKLVFLWVALMTLSLSVMASDDKPITVDKMPQMAQQFIKKYFSNRTVALAKVENEVFTKNYDVVFTNGDKLEFDKKGAWTKIDCEHSAVPADIVPAAIRTYVNKNYPKAQIRKIEKEGKGYEVELSNGWDIKFDKHLQVIGLDR